jgi:DNA-binding response OmpR family regulator
MQRSREFKAGDGMAKILIVDDEPLITAMMEDWLSELGHEVVGPAHNLMKALDLANADIDAAIVDVSLGKDNSYPLVDALIGRGVPLALATGHGQDGIDLKYRAQSTLRKPFDFATFRATIDELAATNARNVSRDTTSATN